MTFTSLKPQCIAVVLMVSLLIVYLGVCHHEIRYNQDIPSSGSLELYMHGIHVHNAHPAKLP
jgi:hypothetical protein